MEHTHDNLRYLHNVLLYKYSFTHTHTHAHMALHVVRTTQMKRDAASNHAAAAAAATPILWPPGYRRRPGPCHKQNRSRDRNRSSRRTSGRQPASQGVSQAARQPVSQKQVKALEFSYAPQQLLPQMKSKKKRKKRRIKTTKRVPSETASDSDTLYARRTSTYRFI